MASRRRQPLLRAEGISHAYGSRTVLQNLSFRLHRGRALALTGRNGTGKSTLLRCAVGAEPLASGTLWWDGRPLAEKDPDVRRGIAAVLDDLDFFPDLTAAEHLDLLARAHGEPDPRAKVREVLAELGILDAGDQFPATLSSGQRHRLALATAFVRPRRLLVLDEPEQRLDEDGRRWLAERLRADLAAGVAVLFASHSAELVDAVAHQRLTVGGQ